LIRTGFFLGLFLPLFPVLLSAQSDDRLIANRTFSFAFEHQLITQPIGRVVSAIGQRYDGVRYEEHTLDRSPEESLVVNLHSFDCVTFVENILALARSIKGNQLTFDSYRRQLEAIRYRNGQRIGYESRLHYFSEWISDNAKKGYLRDLTDSLGGRRIYKSINFLSQHVPVAEGIFSDSSLHRIRQIEQQLTADSLSMIPTSAVASAAKYIRDGDIIAVTTDVPGLDIGHSGFAFRDRQGVLRLLHASEAAKRVEVTGESLIEYLGKHRHDTGIMVARPLPPGE
jgi:hypothetical protein